MTKHILTMAAAVLLSLGLAACSINTGSGADEKKGVVPTNSSASNNTSSDSGSSGNDNSSGGGSTNGSGSTSDNNSGNGNSSSNLTYPSFTHTTLGEQASAFLTQEGQKTLQEKLTRMSNVGSENCGTACSTRNVKTGDVVKAYRTSYANYAVVREAYAEDRKTPTNSYIATVITPTTDKNAVVNATYKGQASWSSSNRHNIRTVAGLTLTVANNKISGEVKQDTPTGSGQYPTLITFGSGDIAVTQNGAVGFNGIATFSARAFGTEQVGTYQGYFAGESAQEVIGTFQSNEQTADAAAQGAFSATRQ